MAVGNLFHLDSFSLRIHSPERVCPIVRPECVLLGKAFCVDFVPARQKSHRTTSGDLSAAWQPPDSEWVVPNTSRGKGSRV